MGKGGNASIAKPSVRQDGGKEGEEELKDVNDTPFLFVRVDPNFMWLRRVELVQREVMWKSQLEVSFPSGAVGHANSQHLTLALAHTPQTADLVGKLEALSSLAAIPFPHKRFSTSAAALVRRCLLDVEGKFGHRVRAAAALALGRWQNLHAPDLSRAALVSGAAVTHSSWDGLKWLLHAYSVRARARVCVCFVMCGVDVGTTHSEAVVVAAPSTALVSYHVSNPRLGHVQSLFCDPQTGLPRVQRFTSQTEYELRKAVIAAVSQIRDAQGFAPLEVLEFCLLALQAFDNSGNAFDAEPILIECIHGLTAAMLDTDLEKSTATTGDDGESASKAAEAQAIAEQLIVPEEGDDGGVANEGAGAAPAGTGITEQDLEDLFDDDASGDAELNPFEDDGDEAGDLADGDEGEDEGDEEVDSGAAGPSPVPSMGGAGPSPLPVSSPFSSGGGGGDNEDTDSIEDGGSIELDSDADEEVLDMDGVGEVQVLDEGSGSDADLGDDVAADADMEGGVVVSGASPPALSGPRAPSLASESDTESDDGAGAVPFTKANSRAHRLLARGWRQLRRCLAAGTYSRSYRGRVVAAVITSLAQLEGRLKVCGGHFVAGVRVGRG